MTPNIDRLAEEGLKFNQAFCNTPVCSATRTSYFTGRLPSQHNVHDWIAGGNGCTDEGIFYTRYETSYTDVLASNDYTCGISGKYHLGDQPLPQHSFSHWFVHQSGGGDYNNPPLVKDLKCVNIEGYITDILTDDAIDFINNHTATGSSKPFYLSVHYTAPHSPYVGSDGKANSMHPPEIVKLYDNATFVSCPQEPMSPYADRGWKAGGLTVGCLGNRECLKGYYAAVTAMDMNIGRLLNTLKMNSLDSSTLVIFASDHGFNAGHHGLWGKGNAAYPLNMFDTSLKIPMIWRHLGVIQPGVEESVVQVVDVAPTLLAYTANLTLPKSSNAAGESFLDLLLDPTKRDSRKGRTIYGEYGQTRYARVNSTRKYITRFSGQIELYDLETDKNESNNLVRPFSDRAMEYDAELLMYDRAMREYFSLLEDPYVSGWDQSVTGLGQLRAVYYNKTGWEPNTPPYDGLQVQGFGEGYGSRHSPSTNKFSVP